MNQRNGSIETMPSQVCGGQHVFMRCQNFAQKNSIERWNIAKRLQLCNRGLGDRHYGKACPKGRIYVKLGLLHQYDRRMATSEPTASAQNQTEPKLVNEDLKRTTCRTRYPHGESSCFCHGGKKQPHLQKTIMMTQNILRMNLIAPRTVPNILKNGDRSR